MVGCQKADPFHFKFKILKNRSHFTSELNGSNTINFSKLIWQEEGSSDSSLGGAGRVQLWVGGGGKRQAPAVILVAFNSPYFRGFQNVPCSGPFHSPCFPCPFFPFLFSTLLSKPRK